MTAALMAAGFDPTLPTFILAECCLVYLTPEQAADVVKWAADVTASAPAAAFALYDPIGGAAYASCT